MNYKEKITNELASHRDDLITNLTRDIVRQYNHFDFEWSVDSDTQDKKARSEWTFNWTYKNRFFDVALGKSYHKEFFMKDGTPMMHNYTNGMGERVSKPVVKSVYDYTFTKKFTNDSGNTIEVTRIATELATKKVDDMLSFYETRLHQKLDETNEAQPITELTIVKFAVMGIFYPTTRIIVEVQNGAKCELTTQVVFKTSSNNNEYFQMPTTFHNAYDPQGRKVVRPSFDAFAYAICDNKDAYSEMVRIRVANEKLDKEYARVQERFQKKIDFVNNEMKKELDKVTAKRPVALNKCA